MSYPFSLIEVFNDPQQGFKGNTSTVVWLEHELPTQKMQAIATDFNQPATTFLWPGDNDGTFGVRWFAPDSEIGLCGHGSLAAVAYLAKSQGADQEVTLAYPGGKLQGQQLNSHSCSMRLSAIPITGEEEVSDVLRAGLGQTIIAHYNTNNKNIVLLEDEAAIKRMRPDFAKLRESDIFGYAVTAPGDAVDFVSRTIVPHVQQLEDHATGSSHAALVPFWAGRLNKNEMLAYQLSPRKGRFACQFDNEEVTLEGRFTVLAQGTLG